MQHLTENRLEETIFPLSFPQQITDRTTLYKLMQVMSSGLRGYNL